MLRLRLAITLSAAALLAMTGCQAPKAQTIWHYTVGDKVEFGNGWEVVVPVRWHAAIDMSEPAPGDEMSPAYSMLELHGPKLRQTQVTLERSEEASHDLANERRLIARGDFAGERLSRTHYEGSSVDMAILENPAGSRQYIFKAWLWVDSGPLHVEASDNQDLNQLVTKGASSDSIVNLVLGEIGLHEIPNR